MYNIRIYKKDGSIKLCTGITNIKKRKRTLEFTFRDKPVKYQLSKIRSYLYV